MPELITTSRTGPLRVDASIRLPARHYVITDRHQQIANHLAMIHGKVTLAVEASGVHAYMASPICLEQDGQVELMKRHLAVNLDKFLAGVDLAACCMKTSKAYRVSTLLKMAPLEQRGLGKVVPKVETHTKSDALEDDGNGNLVPRAPGEVIPVTQLPQDHPCIYFLHSRGFTDLDALWRQFRASWCVKENPKSYYKNLKAGWKATPQNRLVLFIDQFGVQLGWQARILEIVQKKARYYYHPYDAVWVKMQEREDPQGRWQECFEPFDEKFDPRKYLFPPGVQRNKCLMGLDAAIEFNREREDKLAILVEGPLTAARFGPPAMAIMGKYLSPNQAQLVANNFTRVVYVGDNDGAGNTGRQHVAEKMAAHPGVRLQIEDLPPEFKDAADMTPAQAQEFLAERVFIG